MARILPFSESNTWQPGRYPQASLLDCFYLVYRGLKALLGKALRGAILPFSVTILPFSEFVSLFRSRPGRPSPVIHSLLLEIATVSTLPSAGWVRYILP